MNQSIFYSVMKVLYNLHFLENSDAKTVL